MKLRIKVSSLISILDQDYEYEGAVPSEDEFAEHGEMMNLVEEYDADYMDLAEYFELSYLETDRESGYQSRRILIHEKGSRIVTVRREGAGDATDIVIEERLLHKNDYHIDDVGTLVLETYGLEIDWNRDIHMSYLTNMNGLWSKIDMRITFGGTS
ncbi:MAG: hypothetical protein Q4A41_04955 [Bacillota bacterium]|nr:hypothetical protein [Bacillota bacterium]